jgi:hypothetical protein
MRPIVSAVIVVVLAAAAGCSKAEVDTRAENVPQNEGANADVGDTLHIRNVFLLGGTDPASPAQQQTLYGVLINDGRQPVRLERVTVEGGGSVQLSGSITVAPNQPVGAGDKPIGTVTGVRGATVPMTFAFSGAEPLRLNVPVKERTGQYASLTPSPAGSPSPSPTPGTASPSPSPTATGTAPPSPSPTS